MTKHEMKVEQFGEGDPTATLRWAVSNGTTVESGQAVALLTTDKATLEVVSPATGTLRTHLEDGSLVSIGDLLASIHEGGPCDDGAPCAPPVHPVHPPGLVKMAPRRVETLRPSAHPFRDRLVAEWVKHGSLIIALDFDDTVCPWSMRDSNSLVLQQQVMQLVRECQEQGAKVVPWTCSDESRYPFIATYLRENGIDPMPINENIPGLLFGKSRKIYANVYLDDRAGLKEAMHALSEALKLMRSKATSSTIIQ